MKRYGGVVTYISDRVKQFVNEIICEMDNMIWLKLDGSLLNIMKPLYECAIYVHPNLKSEDKPLEDLRNALLMIPMSNDVLVIGVTKDENQKPI